MRLLQALLLGAQLSTVLTFPTKGIPMGKGNSNGTATSTTAGTISSQGDPAATDLRLGVNLAVGGATETNTDTLFTTANTASAEVGIQTSGAKAISPPLKRGSKGVAKVIPQNEGDATARVLEAVAPLKPFTKTSGKNETSEVVESDNTPAATLVDAVNQAAEDLQAALNNRGNGKLAGAVEKAVDDLQAACVRFSTTPM